MEKKKFDVVKYIDQAYFFGAGVSAVKNLIRNDIEAGDDADRIVERILETLPKHIHHLSMEMDRETKRFNEAVAELDAKEKTEKTCEELDEDGCP